MTLEQRVPFRRYVALDGSLTARISKIRLTELDHQVEHVVPRSDLCRGGKSRS